jgi:hypothetical protein
MSANKELIECLEELAGTAKAHPDPQVQAASAVLYTLLGAVVSGRTFELMEFVTPWAQGELDRIQRLTAHRRN